ncbi:META domain-containing protein [Marinobacter sp. CHS3-4]|uniref:META domain-containing protein n=1 Tax=Marinobacter sp. CHS3-4 TaxID=3045174 RepID=UPI0024B540DD|nr:META domain-containing protein [Marinobacter sp. CHS3-4]MDI9244166.1 META domain-containing protein [Marinobacter sp. CHS3-4]
MRGLQTLAVTGILAGLGLAGCASTPDMPEHQPEPAMQCGQAEIKLELNEDGDWLQLTHLDQVTELERVVSASGARYESIRNDDTWFWSKGDTATLTLEGMSYPTCVASGAVPKPFTATGNEPFWKVTLESGQLTLERPNQPTATMDYQTVARLTSGRTYRAKAPGLSVEVITASQMCRDSMSGMLHPYQVRVSINGKTMSGCGGNPSRLLMGDAWVVEDIGGRGIIDRSQATVQFLPEGRVIGTSSCNRYTGRWNLNGEAIGVSGLAVTRRACPPALMNQEDRLLKLLESVSRFDINPQGALLLISDTGEKIRAFQATP